jgi:hypothetical protein
MALKVHNKQQQSVIDCALQGPLPSIATEIEKLEANREVATAVSAQSSPIRKKQSAIAPLSTTIQQSDTSVDGVFLRPGVVTR